MNYKIIGSNDVRMFIHIMTRLNITHIDGMIDGVSKDTINEVNKIAEEKDIIILALPDNILFDKNRGKKFIFVPMDKDSKCNTGVFMPIEAGDSLDNYECPIETIIPPQLGNIDRDMAEKMGEIAEHLGEEFSKKMNEMFPSMDKCPSMSGLGNLFPGHNGPMGEFNKKGGDDLRKMVHGMAGRERTEKGESAKQEGRPNRVKDNIIHKDDIDRINKFLRPGDDKDIDVNDFLKLIDDE